MAIDFQVDRTRFPYEVRIDGVRVAVLYSTHFLDLIENVARCNELLFEMGSRVNRLISIVGGHTSPGPADLIPVKQVRYSALSLTDKEVQAVSGIAVGQRYRWPKSNSIWQVTSVSGFRRVATLAWVEDSGNLSRTYTKDVDFDRLASAYSRVDDPDEGEGELDGFGNDFEDDFDPFRQEASSEPGI